MRRIILMLSLLIMVGFFAGVASAGKTNLEQGEKLFNDPTLGGSTNDKSCATCHPGGEGLEKAGTNPKLTKMINRCIVGALKGEKLDGRKSELRSLKMYIESLGK